MLPASIPHLPFWATLVHRRKMKWGLAGMALFLALLLVVWPQLTYNGDQKNELSGVNPRVDSMRKARLQGIDGQGRPFVLTADRVQKLDTAGQYLTLTDLHAEVRLPNNNRISLAADSGDINQTTSLLNLVQRVTITRQDGFRMDLSSLTYNWLDGVGESAQPITGYGAHHRLQAEGLKIEQHGNRLVFLGHAALAF
jgi:hypothetical protein